MRFWTVLALPLALATVIALAQSPTPAAAENFDCFDFANQAEAEEYLLPGDPHFLDSDHDGVACERLPCPCSKTAGGAGNPPPTFLQRPTAIRVSKLRVAAAVKASAVLREYELESCARLGDRSIDCRLKAHGATATASQTCRFKVEVRATIQGKGLQISTQIASRKC